jgi:hypothetical protein
MEFPALVKHVADILKDFDCEKPIHKSFQAGIGPFGEPQTVRKIAECLSAKRFSAQTKLKPDLQIEPPPCDGQRDKSC